MGRWLDALKRHENAPDTNPQNPQNSANRGFEGFESFNSTDLQKKSESVPSDQRNTLEARTHEDPLFAGQSKEKS